MARRKTLTDEGVKALKPRTSRYAHPDPELSGHYIRVTPKGAKSFVAVALDPASRQVWTTIGDANIIGIDKAREKARGVIRRTRAGEDRAGPQSFQSVAEEWFKRYVEAKELRSGNETRRMLDKHILPAWSGRDFSSIKRGDITKLLDHVEDGFGASAADNVLKRVSTIFAWYQTRHDDYVSPVVRGMRRTSIKEQARDRILSDDELRAVWTVAEANGTFGTLVRILLLTAQRRDKVASMRWEDLSIDGVWTIRTEDREKGNAGELKLPKMAADLIAAQPRMGDNPHVFAGRGGSYLTGYSKAKMAFDRKVAGKLAIQAAARAWDSAHPGEPLPGHSCALGDEQLAEYNSLLLEAVALPAMRQWGLHDLRRTARSLLSRAGVRPDISERVLGHAINGVEGTYDRHQYSQEKAHALNALATLIDGIVHPPETVVPMRRRKK